MGLGATLAALGISARLRGLEKAEIANTVLSYYCHERESRSSADILRFI
jgi:hypothetical protein